jgi:hypothetical protein
MFQTTIGRARLRQRPVASRKKAAAAAKTGETGDFEAGNRLRSMLN